MKKTAIILALCLTVLSGCGRVESATDREISPFEIQKPTDENDEVATEDNSLPTGTNVSTVSGDKGNTTTTAKTGVVHFVKRTGIVTTPRVTIPVGKVTVNRPIHTNPSPNSNNNPVPTVKTTTVTYATTVTSTSTTQKISSPVVQIGDLVCKINENGISVEFKGEPVQNIEVDTSYMLETYENSGDSSKLVNIYDFDFDGHYDMFIPNSNDDYNIYGTFFHYNADTALYEQWDAMSGITTFDSISEDDGTFTSTVRQNNNEFDEKTYEWRVISEETGEKELRLVRRKKQYALQDSTTGEYNTYTDYYEYTDGVEVIVKREKLLFDDEGNFLGTEEIPIEWLT